MRTLYRGGRIFTADTPQWAQAVVTDRNRIAYVGQEKPAREMAGPDAEVVDLDGGLLLPGFIDAHVHMLMTGEAELRAHLGTAKNLQEIQQRVVNWAHTHPEAPRVLGRSWLFSALPDGRPTREMLDAVISDRPVYLYANDYHSIWVNTAALQELNITTNSANPAGGRIVRDAQSGEATGHIEETAVHEIVRPFLARQTIDADRDSQLASALHAYATSGITGVIEMGMEPDALAAMVRAEQVGQLTTRVVGHWWMRRGGTRKDHLEQVAEAALLARHHRSPWLRMAGVKFVVDGVIDGGTAAMLEPYANGSNADPIWDYEALAPAVAAADAAGLQIALHAIGDSAIRIALDAVENAVTVNGPRARRHRIEHLEYIDPADVPRLAQLGITASMQPVHADPAVQDNWRTMLGDHRVQRAWPWTEMTSVGAQLVFGTDAPTAPHQPLPNMFIAATRRSSMNPSLPPNLPRFALPLPEAVRHGTRDAAWSCFSEQERGRLHAGLFADLVVIDRDPFAEPSESLLQAHVVRTVVDGRVIHKQ